MRARPRLSPCHLVTLSPSPLPPFPRSRVTTCRKGAALVSAVAILLVVAAFAGIFLSAHAAQLSTEEAGIHRLRAQAAAMAATQLTLWELSNESDLQEDLARVVYEGDTSFEADPLFLFQGDLAGATFSVAVWPGAETVRLRSRGVSGDVYFERWAHAPMELVTSRNLLVGGDFEDSGVINRWPLWLGTYTLGTWCAGYGFSLVDDPREWGWGALPWNITRDFGNHFAESLHQSNTMGEYVEGDGAKGTLVLDFDYIRTTGNLEVTVRGVDALPRSGLLVPGLPGYRDWTDAGTVLYDSHNLPKADSWTHFRASLDAGDGYTYYAVHVSAQGGSGTPHSPQRAIDNLTLAVSH
jgi:hypothetical protein